MNNYEVEEAFREMQAKVNDREYDEGYDGPQYSYTELVACADYLSNFPNWANDRKVREALAQIPEDQRKLDTQLYDDLMAEEAFAEKDGRTTIQKMSDYFDCWPEENETQTYWDWVDNGTPIVGSCDTCGEDYSNCNCPIPF